MTASRLFSNVIRVAQAIVIAGLISSCNDDADRPEVINKLRALGVQQTPINAKPGDQVQLTFYLAGPKGLTLQPSVELDSDAKYSVPVAVTPSNGAVSESDAGALALYSYQATLNVESSPGLDQSLVALGYGKLRYKVKFEATSDDETIVGDTLVYPSGSPQLTWTGTDISLDKPAATTSRGIVNLESTVTSNGQESNRIAWFVSAGAVKNRRARITTWNISDAGPQTVIVTARGSKSGAFAIKTVSVTLD